MVKFGEKFSPEFGWEKIKDLWERLKGVGEQEWQIAEYVSIGIIVMHIVLGFRMNKVLLRP